MLIAFGVLSNVLGPEEVSRLRKVLGALLPLPPVEPTNDQLVLEFASKMQQQENWMQQVEPLQQRVADAEVKLIKQQDQLRDTVQTILNLDTEIASGKKIWPSPWTSPRVRLLDEEMFSAKRKLKAVMTFLEVLARWFKGVEAKKSSLEQPGKTGHSATTMEKDLMKLVSNMRRTEFLHIACKLTKDAGVPENVNATPTRAQR